jgi:HlyD family secretion protein
MVETPTHKRVLKRRVVLFTLLIILPVLGTGAYLGWRSIRPARATAAPRTFTVRRNDLVVKVTETGTVEPLKKVEVKSKVGGKVVRLHAAEGDRVQAGQVLAVLDPIEQESQVAQIRAQVAAARARLEQAETQARHEQRTVALGITDAEKQLRSASIRLDQAVRQARVQPELTRTAVAQSDADLAGARQALQRLNQSERPQELAEAQAGYDQAQAESELAEKALARQQALLKRGFVPQSAVDEAEQQATTAKARLHTAATRLKNMQARVDTNRREAEERVARAEAARAAARANTVQDALREDDVKAARASYEAAQVALQRARAQQSQVRVREAEVEAARASVRQIENSLTEVETRLRDTVLRAPMSGVVTRRYVEEGELVTSGTQTFSSGTPLMQIADLSRMQVRVQVNEVDVARVKVGERATIELDASRGEHLPGRVTAVAPASGAPQAAQGQGGGGGGGNPGIVKFEVKIDILESDPRLRPGMSANVDIITAERKGVLVLPVEAVDLKRARVKRQVGEKIVEEPVKLGLQGDNLVEIRSGLKEGDRVLLATYSGPPRRKLRFTPEGPRD